MVYLYTDGVLPACPSALVPRRGNLEVYVVPCLSEFFPIVITTLKTQPVLASCSSLSLFLPLRLLGSHP